MNGKRLASRLALGALVAWAVGSSIGCAAERDPIDRTQPNALPKSFFVGQDLKDASDDPEFYWRNYVVDASASQSLVGVGEWGHVDRIRWQITEDELIARKAYQIADGEDDKGGAFAKTPNGTIVAAYKIQSHFDIRRDYNAQTGEETNVIVENTSDRPWQDREYIRVDWSQNLVGQDNPMFNDMFTGKVFGNFSVLPVSYAVTDPNDDDALHVDLNQGYLDVTNKYTVTPAMSSSPFSDVQGDVPTCLVVGLYTGSSTYECDPQEATVRSSFLKIDPEDDFERLENTKASGDVLGNPGGEGDSLSVGVLSAGRQGWDPQYGFTDSLYHRFAYIHDIWKKSHQASTTCDSNDDANKDGSADQCENAVTGYAGSNGSQCDVFAKKCTLPVRDREIKTIGYWINKEAPAELQDPLDESGNPTARGTLEDLTYSWNQLMKVAVATSREVECRRTGDGKRADCHAQFFDSTSDPKTKEMLSYGGWLIDKVKDPSTILTFCHNPVRSYDLHDTCGKEGDKARVGDIRKNFIFYWPYASRAPWGGIADWNGDPLTGRIIGGAAQIMGRSATYAAAMQRDVIQIAMGDQKLEDVIDGAPSETFSKTLIDGRAPKAFTPTEIASREDAIDLTNLRKSLAARPWTGATRSQRLLNELAEKSKEVADVRATSTALAEYNTLAQKLAGSQYEAQLVDSHWLVGALGMDPSTAMSDAVMAQASPLRGMDPGRMQAMRELTSEGLRAHGVCFLGNEAPAAGSVYLPSLAGYFKAKYAGLDPVERGKKIYDDLWKEAVKGIALHEIGHSLGLLHQFASSWDAPNYDPQYWQLRTNEGESAGSCKGKPRQGASDSCMGPRYLDPETQDEQGLAGESRPGILYFANTSTMEYQLERGGETVGLGTYDQMSMKALYGRVLETFDPKDMPVDEQQDFRFKNWSQLQDKDLIIDGNSLVTKHYTETARRMRVFDPKRDCRPATEEEKQTAGWRIVHGKVCAPPPKDHWSWQDFKSDSVNGDDPEFNAPYWHVVDKDGKERVRWPYRWGTTHNSYFHTNDSDAGADPYEVAHNTAIKFEQMYPWSYFRRHNREYDYKQMPSATADRYFDRMRSYHWLVATDLARLADPSALDDDDDLRPTVMAQGEMFDMLSRALLMPEPGDYYTPGSDPDVKARQPVDTSRPILDVGSGAGTGLSQPAFSIGVGDGRYIGEEFDNDLGGSWDYLSFIKHAGFTVEKGLALQALVDGRPSLFTITRQNYLDGRGVKVNFRNDLPQAVDRLVGGILAEDWESVAPGVPSGPSSSSGPIPLDLTGRTVAPKRDANVNIVFPNVGYKQQLSTVMFSALFSRLNTDMTLMNKMRVWLDGQIGQVTVPEAEQVRFTDPASGYTYVARKYGTESIDGKAVDRGIASRMVLHANAYVEAAYEVEKDADGKLVLDAFGRPTVALGEDGQPVVKDPTLAGQLTQYVGLLDAMREIETKLGFGPLAGNEGGDD
jgi:hypothetical protein